MQPENPAPWLELARFHYVAEPPDLCAAYQAFNEAYVAAARRVTGNAVICAAPAVVP